MHVVAAVHVVAAAHFAAAARFAAAGQFEIVVGGVDGVLVAQVVGLLLLACLEAPYDYIVVQAVPNNCNLFVH